MTLTVATAPLTVTADNKSRAYGAANPAFTATYSGFVTGESATVLSGAPSYSTDATTDSPSGSYVITPVQGTLTAANYSFTFVTGTLAIDAQAPSLAFNPLPAKTYGAAPFTVAATGGAPSMTITYSSSNPAVAVVVDATVTIIGAGETVITASQQASPGYAAVSAQQTLTVKKAPLLVTAESYERHYGEPDPVFTATYSGFVNGEDTTILSGAPVITTTAGSGSPTGAYPITPALGTVAADNYDFFFAPGTLAVDLALQNISFAGIASKTYGDEPYDPGATGGGSGNPLSYSSSDPAVASVSGSTLTLVGAGQTFITVSQAGNNYYAPASTQQLLTVAPKSMTVSADNKSRTYGAVNPALTFSYSGFATGDDQTKLSGAPAVSAFADTASVSGSYPITTAAGNLFAANYTFVYVNGVLTVEKAAATVTLDAASLNRTYDGSAQAATATTNPTGLTVVFSYAYSNSNPVDSPTGVGSYTVSAVINDTAYSGTVSGVLTIAKANQTVSFASPAAARTYGNADFGPGAVASSGLVVTYGSDNAMVATITAGGLIHSVGAGTATITATQAGSANYNAASATLALTVAKANLSVIAVNKSRAAGVANPVFTATYPGFVNGENAGALSGAPLITTTAANASPTGSYPITPATGTLAAANYSFSFIPGTLAVGMGSQNVIFNPLEAKTYGDAPFDLIATGGGSGNPVAFSSSNQAVATVSGVTVAIVGAGETVITASTADVAGTFAYTPDFGTVLGVGAGQSLSVTFTPSDATLYTTATRNVAINVNSGTPQTLTFAPLTPKALGSAPFTLAATATSGLAVTFASSDSSVVSISGSTATLHKAGVVTITASQTGDGVWLAAPEVNRTLTVTSFGKPTLAVSTLANGAVTTESVLNLSGSAASGNGAITSLTLNGAPQTLADDNTFSAAYLLVPGANLLTTMATDAANQTATNNRTVTLDATAPGLTVTGTVDSTDTVTVTVVHDGQSYSPAVAVGAFSQPLTFTDTKTYAVVVTAGSGYAFTTWNLTSGSGPILNPAGNSTTVAMNGPNSVTATFQAKTVSLSAVIGAATGNPGGSRTWPVIITNTGGATVSAAQLTGVTLSYSGSCKPTATTVFPVSMSDIAPGNSATGSVTVDFSTCNSPKLKTLKFSVAIGYSANGGSSTGTLGLSGVSQ